MRYESYSASEIKWNPDRPSHWKCDKAKRFFSNPKVINRGNAEDNVLSLTLKGVIRNNKEKPIGLSPEDYSTYQVFQPNELVFKLIDLNNISTSRVGLVPETGIMSSAYIRFSPKIDLNVRYFYYQYFDWYKRNIFNGLGAGVRQTISGSELGTFEILVPPHDEQDQIVRYLDWQISKINKLIAAKKKKIALLEEQEKTIVNGAVLHGLHHSELADSGNKWVGFIPANWDVINLGKFCSFQNGISESGDFFTSGTPFVSYGDVYRHLELPAVVKGVAKATSQQQEVFSVREGDIFFTRTSENIEEIGMAAVCKNTIENAVFSGFIIRCRPRKHLVDIDFLKFYLQSIAVRNHFSSMMNIVIRASLGQNLLKQMPVVLPPMEEQKEIATYLEALHLKYTQIKDLYQSEINTLEEYKTKLISDVVTGQIDVRSIEIPEYEYVADSSDEEESEDDEKVTELEQDE